MRHHSVSNVSTNLLFLNCTYAFINLALGMELRHREQKPLAYVTHLHGAVLMSEPNLFDSSKLACQIKHISKFISIILELRQFCP